MRFDIRKLQNGNSIEGIAVSGVPGEEVNLTQNNAGAIGTAFMVWLASRIDKPIFTLKICVGQDSRVSGNELKEGIMMGVQMTGSRSYDAGLATTPAMLMSQTMPAYEFDGAVMVTAGNLPYNRNGFKFFTQDGCLKEDDIAWILDKAYKYAFIGEWFECEPTNVMAMYAAHIRGTISAGLGGGNNNLEGMHIVVDAGNGAGGFFATDVLAKLGADISGSRFLEPDGMFANHLPDPENEEAVKALAMAVKDNHADLGVIFDADVSHCTVVGADGTVLETGEMSDGAMCAAKAIIEATKLKRES